MGRYHEMASECLVRLESDLKGKDFQVINNLREETSDTDAINSWTESDLLNDVLSSLIEKAAQLANTLSSDSWFDRVWK